MSPHKLLPGENFSFQIQYVLTIDFLLRIKIQKHKSQTIAKKTLIVPLLSNYKSKCQYLSYY